MKTTKYFQMIRERPDRAIIRDKWIRRVVEFPEQERLQADGGVRRWGLLPDGETVHNAFFDRGHKPWKSSSFVIPRFAAIFDNCNPAADA